MVGANLSASSYILMRRRRYPTILVQCIFHPILRQREGGGADNDINLTPFVNYEHNNTRNDEGDWQLRWAVAFDSGVGVRRRGRSGENGVWQLRRLVIRVGTQQSINDPLQWMMTRRRGQQRGNALIKLR
jgi:hypothetical protein